MAPAQNELMESSTRAGRQNHQNWHNRHSLRQETFVERSRINDVSTIAVVESLHDDRLSAGRKAGAIARFTGFKVAGQQYCEATASDVSAKKEA